MKAKIKPYLKCHGCSEGLGNSDLDGGWVYKGFHKKGHQHGASECEQEAHKCETVFLDPRIIFRQRCRIVKIQEKTSFLSNQLLFLPCIYQLVAPPSTRLPVSLCGQ